MINLPNTITASRVLLIPVFVLLDQAGMRDAAFGVLLYSLLSDFFDGWVARRLGQTTDLGALMDPIADKMIALFYYAYLWEQVPLYFVVVVLARNLAQILCIPILVWWLKRSFKVKPKQLPKWVTALSFTFIGIFYFGLDLGPALHWVLVPIALGELWILVTYVPRLIHIARGTHDTFE